MKIILLIGLGSFIGGVTRYLLTQVIQPKSQGAFPYGTLAVNLIGCLAIGIVFGFVQKGNMSSEIKFFLATGILGGFTTFSAFSNETVTMLNGGSTLFAFLYVLLSVVIGLALTFLGLSVSKIF